MGTSNDDVERTAEAIRTMEIRGAAAIARSAAASLRNFALSWEGASTAEFVKALQAARRTLLETRPTAVSLRNGLNASLKLKPDQDEIKRLIQAIEKR